MYFSYNPDIFQGELSVEWVSGSYSIQEILERISSLQDLLFTQIGNQIVFYREGEMPPLPSPNTAEVTEPMPLISIRKQ